MTALTHILLALTLTSGGALIGRSLATNNEKADLKQTNSETLEVHPVRPGAQLVKEDPGNRHDLAGMTERFRTWGERKGGQRKELERLSVTALKELLQEQMALVGKGAMNENQARQSVISGALGELYRREGVAAIEWVDALDDQGVRRAAMQSILTTSVREHPDVAMPWILQFLEQNGKTSPSANTFASVAFAGAAERGADELIRVYGMFPNKPRGDPFNLVKFPADFDFRKVHATLSGKVDMAGIYDEWAAQDREGAWQAVKGDLAARGQPGGRYFGSLVLGAVTREGEEGGMKWAVERLAELPPDQRKFCLANVDHLGKLTPIGISSISSSLPSEDRIVFSQGMLNSSRGEQKTIAALSPLPREQLIEVLTEARKRNAALLNSKSSDSFQESIRGTFREVEAHFSLTSEELQSTRGNSTGIPK